MESVKQVIFDIQISKKVKFCQKLLIVGSKNIHSFTYLFSILERKGENKLKKFF